MRAAQILSEAGRRSGLSRRAWARRAGTSSATLAAYAAGRKVPSTDTLNRLVQAAGFDLAVELVPRGPFEDRTRQGRRLVDVLELAEQFPTIHDWKLRHPRWPS